MINHLGKRHLTKSGKHMTKLPDISSPWSTKAAVSKEPQQMRIVRQGDTVQSSCQLLLVLRSEVLFACPPWAIFCAKTGKSRTARKIELVHHGVAPSLHWWWCLWPKGSGDTGSSTLPADVAPYILEKNCPCVDSFWEQEFCFWKGCMCLIGL